VNEPTERVIGSDFKRFIVANDKSKFNKSLAQRTDKKNNVLIISLVNSLFLKLSFKRLPAYLQGDYCILVATDISEMKREEIKLLELSRLLEEKLDVIQRLRMQLVDSTLDLKVEINKSRDTIKKLVKEIDRRKLVETALKHKLRQKKATA